MTEKIIDLDSYEYIHGLKVESQARYEKKIDGIGELMQVLLLENPSGIDLGKLYGTLQEEGYDENDIRSAFLDLVSVNKIDVDISRKGWNIIPVIG